MNVANCTGTTVVNSCHDEAIDGCEKYVEQHNGKLYQCVQHRILRNKCMPESWDSKKKRVDVSAACVIPPAPSSDSTDSGIQVSTDVDGNLTVQTDTDTDTDTDKEYKENSNAGKGSETSSITIGLGIAILVVIGVYFYYHSAQGRSNTTMQV